MSHNPELAGATDRANTYEEMDLLKRRL